MCGKDVALSTAEAGHGESLWMSPLFLNTAFKWCHLWVILVKAFIAIFGIMLSLALLEISFRLVTFFSATPVKWSDRPHFYYGAEAADTR